MVTLEEAFNGCIKKMKVTRWVLQEDGFTAVLREKVLTIEVGAGWKAGTRVTFEKEGDQEPNRIPADLVFVVEYKEHQRFTRVKNDLEHTAVVSLAEALTGCLVGIKMLDGRLLQIPINDVIMPGYVHRVPGEGMPLTRDPSRRGDLVLRFDIVFPTSLSDASKGLVQKALR